MRYYIDSWVALLREANPAWGFPLVVAGLVMMFMGWQVHKLAVPFASFVVGMIIGQVLFDSIVPRLIVGGVLGIVLAGVSYFTIQISVGILGGLVGAFVVAGYMSTFKGLHLPNLVEAGAAMFGFVGGTAISFVMFREMAIIVTSFLGSLLLVSGLNCILPQYVPSLYGTITSFLSDYPAFFVPFVIGGPTLIGALTQMAGADRADAGTG